MERQCWTNAQCSRRESVEIVGIPSSVHRNQLEDSVCKIFDKLNCNIVKDNLENCQRLKGDRVIVKFSKRKECKQVLIVKVTRKMLIWLILALREIVRFIYQSKFMLLLQNAVVMEQKATQYGKNLQLIYVWWHN